MMTSSFQNKSVEAEKALNQLFGTDYNVKDEMQIIQVRERRCAIRPNATWLNFPACLATFPSLAIYTVVIYTVHSFS